MIQFKIKTRSSIWPRRNWVTPFCSCSSSSYTSRPHSSVRYYVLGEKAAGEPCSSRGGGRERREGRKKEEEKARRGEFTGERGRNVVEPASSKRARVRRRDSIHALKRVQRDARVRCRVAFAISFSLVPSLYFQ